MQNLAAGKEAVVRYVPSILDQNHTMIKVIFFLIKGKNAASDVICSSENTHILNWKEIK